LRLSTVPIFSLSCFSQVRILRFTVLLLNISLGAIALPGNTQAINFLKANNTNIQLSTKHSTLLAQSTVAQASTSILYVNSSEGNDTANGSDRTPFKTITHALKTAQSGTTILLAPGVYSSETGEIFPLVLKAGVTLQGDPATRGQDILIQGEGLSTSQAWTQQSLTIEIPYSATLNGVTVTNPSPQGYGVGSKSSNPFITNNTFTGNGYGMAIVGDSNARIQNNYFDQNRIAGIGVAGIAQPVIQDNIFEHNGSAVMGRDRAAPLIVNNRMTQNQDGMVFQGSAQPMVRSNSVERNRRYGLIAKDTARPDLGTTASPGENFFRNNGISDVNVKATDQGISAVGNEWLNAVGTLNPTQLPLTSSDSTAFPIPSTLSSNLSPESPRPMQIVQLAISSAQSNQVIPLKSAHSSPVTTRVQPALQPLSDALVNGNSLSLPLSEIAKPLDTKTLYQPAVKVRTSATPENAKTVPVTLLETFPLPPLASQPVNRPNIPLKPVALKPVQRSQLPLLSLGAAIPLSIPVPPPETPITPIAIAIPVPLPETTTLRSNLKRSDLEMKPTRLIQAMIEPPKVAKKTSTGLLPVPSPNIPLGKIGEMPSVYSVRGVVEPSLGANSIVSVNNLNNDSKGNSIRFRVVVTVRKAMEQAQVLALVPDAFLMAFPNNGLMQVGAFSDRTKAEQLTRMLASQGISSTIESINP
jgi:parallel beta-helix repeat protein